MPKNVVRESKMELTLREITVRTLSSEREREVSPVDDDFDSIVTAPNPFGSNYQVPPPSHLGEGEITRAMYIEKDGFSKVEFNGYDFIKMGKPMRIVETEVKTYRPVPKKKTK